MPNVLRIQCPCLVHVIGPFDDRPAIGEDGELVTIGIELKQEPVVTHVAEHFQVPGQLLEVEPGGGAMRYLHGIAATKARSLRPLVAFKPFEPAMFAAGTIHTARIWSG